MDEILYIYKKPDVDEYYVARVQKSNRGRVINKCEKELKYEKIAEIKISKNSVSVFNKLTKFNDGIKRKGNHIKLIGTNIQDFITEVNKLVSV